MFPLARWLIIDKPMGCTSHDVVAQARRRLGLKRIGHSGTLDPDATGVMVLALGKATRLIPYLQGGKTYEATVQLGRSTDSYDRSGETTAEHSVPNFSQTDLEQALQPFRGHFEQIPPMVSARSWQGQRLYKLHRKGIDVPERPTRRVEVSELCILDWASPVLKLLIRCSAGTYIRSIAHELGQALGCGACLYDLRRTEANGSDLTHAAEIDTLQHLTENPLPGLAADRLLTHLPAWTLPDEAAVSALRHGKTMPFIVDLPEGEDLKIYTPEGHFAALAEVNLGSIQPRLLLIDPA